MLDFYQMEVKRPSIGPTEWTSSSIFVSLHSQEFSMQMKSVYVTLTYCVDRTRSFNVKAT